MTNSLEMYITNWIGRVTGSLSLLGSTAIVYMIILDRKRKLERPYHRLMLCMAVFDILNSSAIVCGVSAVPKSEKIYGAIGNESTCAAQGFFLMIGYATPLYNSCLNIFYVLTIRYNIAAQRFSRYEPILHLISISVPISLAVVFTIQGNIEPVGSLCYPVGTYASLSIATIVMTSFVICAVSMVLVSLAVVSQAKDMEKYKFRGSRSMSSRLFRDKEETINQAISYASAFMITFSFPIIWEVIEEVRGYGQTPYFMKVLSAIFYPLQGAWNFCFYVRPGIASAMTANPDISFITASLDVIFHPDRIVQRRRASAIRRRILRSRSGQNDNLPSEQTNDQPSTLTQTTREIQLSVDMTDDKPSKSRNAKERNDTSTSCFHSENEQEEEKTPYADGNDYTNIETPRMCNINNTTSPLKDIKDLHSAHESESNALVRPLPSAVSENEAFKDGNIEVEDKNSEINTGKNRGRRPSLRPRKSMRPRRISVSMLPSVLTIEDNNDFDDIV